MNLLQLFHWKDYDSGMRWRSANNCKIEFIITIYMFLS